MKNIIIAGASGMVGGLILEECLSSKEIAQVTSLVRKKTDKQHPKLQEVVISDFSDYSAQLDFFENIDAAFFCIGVYTGQVDDEKFKVITVDYAVAFAQALNEKSPKATICLLSGQGADRSEKSRTSFARYKGMAENQIAAMNLTFYSFRPGYIYPVTPRQEPNLMYKVSRALYPLFKLMGDNMSVKSTELANAMFKVALHGTTKEVLENRDILKVLK